MREYFTARDALEFTFYRIPKALITDQVYRGIPTDAKLLYGLLLDRLGLSQQHGWVDELGRVYVFYKVSAIQSNLCCCKEKACKLLCALESAGLIERVRQGNGAPSRIYLKRFNQRSEKQTSGGRKNRP